MTIDLEALERGVIRTRYIDNTLHDVEVAIEDWDALIAEVRQLRAEAAARIQRGCQCTSEEMADLRAQIIKLRAEYEEVRALWYATGS